MAYKSRARRRIARAWEADRSTRWVVLTVILLTLLVIALVWWMDTYPRTPTGHAGLTITHDLLTSAGITVEDRF